jgi:predicted  nucleic acid-binding Zn-ribbon protein
MITASEKQQELLLEVAKLDVTVTRVGVELENAQRSEELDKLRTMLLATSESLLQAHATSENLSGEIKKINSDVELVEQRIARDLEKAKQVSSEREQKAVNQELESLKTRLTALEDSELSLMESLEVANAEIITITQKRTKLNQELETELSKQHGLALTLSAQLSELNQKRDLAYGKLDEELQSLYARKALRGTAVAQTLGRDCSACRLSINAVQFEAMMAEPANHVPTCPNCDAMIIR